ncbi:methyl-accepting chemotaxis protein [Chitiniphilus purpureus]|uniref:Methyl-accepting chemotaxis protein n=1 Tax=Chitiniphilus purpureus TaxID=2981137 RepID=A0ABY6DSI3_9NEIS|nr:methyl-accepting chemotaxis protein [Chitiniphilus sp. CD1]UXY16982.1 methyl-accepting chemotaxis protein [Chitiniphilus sp. CD1]
MKISHRLLLLIGIAVFSLVLVGAVGFLKFNSVQNKVEHLSGEAVAGLESIYRINNAYKVQQLLLYQAGSSFDADLRTKLIAHLKSQRQLIDTHMQSYAKTIATPQARQLYDAVLPRMADFHRASADVIAQAEDFGDVAASLVKARETAIAAEGALQKLVDYNLAIAQRYSAEADAEQRQAKTQFTLLIVVAVLLLCVVGTLLMRAIQRPLAQMHQTVTEIGQSLDFTRRVTVTGHDEIGMTLTAFNGLLDRLQQSLRDLRGKIGEVSGSANQLSQTANQLSQTASQASDAASNMAATVEEVTVSINHVADRSGEADHLSRQSGQLARDGGAVIEATVAKIDGISNTVRDAADEMGQLQAKSANVSAVVNVIKEIADQTNLLALNAAIEAARAGEQGRGFAVVADEVRKLAERTSQSTQEISATIVSIQDGANSAVARMQNVVVQVEEGVREARAAGEAIRSIRGSAGEVVARVADITAAIQEQSVASTNISQVVERIANMSEENSAVAGTTLHSAERLQQLAHDMEQTVGRYRI